MPTPAIFISLNGVGNPVEFAAKEISPGLLALFSVPVVDGAPVDAGNPMPVTFSSGGSTAIAGAATEVVTGGVAVIAFLGGAIENGGYIVNPQEAQSLFIDPVNEPDAAAPGPNGTTVEIGPGQVWTVPGGLTGPVWVNAPDDGHTFTAVSF